MSRHGLMRIFIALSLMPMLIACNSVGQASASSTPTTDAAYPAAKGTLVVVNQKDSTAYLIDLSTGKVAREIQTGAGPHEAAVSPDGKLIAITNYGVQGKPGNTLTIVSLPAGEVVKTVSLNEYMKPHGIDFLDNDRVIVTSEASKAVVIANIKENKVEGTIQTDQLGSHMLALTPDKKSVYTANVGSSSVSAMDLKSMNKLGDVATGPNCEGIAVSPDGKFVWAANRNGKSISVVDTKKMEVVKTIEAESVPYRAAFTLDAKRVLVPCPEAAVLLIYHADKMELDRKVELKTETVPFTYVGGPPAPMPTGVTLHPDGKYAYLSILNAKSVAVIDLEKGELVGRLEAGMNPDGIAVSPVAVAG